MILDADGIDPLAPRTTPPLSPAQREESEGRDARIVKYLFGQAPDRHGAYYRDVMTWEQFEERERREGR